MTDEKDTHFAPAARASTAEIEELVNLASSSPVVDALLTHVRGLLAVIDEHRQIVAVNQAYLEFLGIEDASQALGLRPGESVDCLHAHEMPGGCGTSKHCATCGAAIAIVTCLVKDTPVDRDCALEATREGQVVSLDLRVSAVPLKVEGRRFVLLYLEDITEARRRACLERAFLHDMNNVVFGLSGLTGIFMNVDAAKKEEIAPIIHHLSNRLLGEVQLQRLLAQAESGKLPISPKTLTAASILEEIDQLFRHHPAAENKALRLDPVAGELTLETDRAFLVRVLGNMVVNAFEATASGGEVRLDVTTADEQVMFRVHNVDEIPEEITHRIYQRYFSTKAGQDRGQGTYIMKLLGESYLGGHVGFETSPQGTTFHITLPVRVPHAQK